jgi:hypothetical protein
MKKWLIIFVGFSVVLGTLSLLSLKDKYRLAEADKFNVINVQGKIVFEKTGAEMKRGDIYVSGMNLDFIDSKSRASIVNKSQGRLVITGSSKGKVKVLPAANNISSRAGSLLNVIDLKKHFSDRYLVLKRSEVQIGKEAFPMGNKYFFYLTYDYNGEEIAKKLRNEDDMLVLDRDEIFKVDGEVIPYEEKEMTLYYRKEGKGMKINTFTPVFPDNDELVAEVKVLLNSYSDVSDLEQAKAVTSYLNEFYGNAHKANLKSWLKAEFNL